MVRVCRCLFVLFYLNTSSCKWAFMAPQQKKKEVSPNVKMKMNEEEGPGEEDDTPELDNSAA